MFTMFMFVPFRLSLQACLDLVLARGPTSEQPCPQRACQKTSKRRGTKQKNGDTLAEVTLYTKRSENRRKLTRTPHRLVYGTQFYSRLGRCFFHRTSNDKQVAPEQFFTSKPPIDAALLSFQFKHGWMEHKDTFILPDTSTQTSPAKPLRTPPHHQGLARLQFLTCEPDHLTHATPSGGARANHPQSIDSPPTQGSKRAPRNHPAG